MDQLSCPVNLTKFANKNDSITGWGAVLSPGDPCEDVKLCGTPVLLNYWPLCLMWGPAAGWAPPSPGDYGLIITQLNDQTVSKPSPARHNFNINLKSQQTKYQVSSLLLFGVIIKTFWFFRIFLIYYKKIFLKPEDLKRKYFELFKSFISFQQTELWSNYTNFKELQFSSRHFHTGLVQ